MNAWKYSEEAIAFLSKQDATYKSYHCPDPETPQNGRYYTARALIKEIEARSLIGLDFIRMAIEPRHKKPMSLCC